MEFGMFHEFQALPGETAAQSFANSLAQVDAAERWGLDAMWLAELHISPIPPSELVRMFEQGRNSGGASGAGLFEEEGF